MENVGVLIGLILNLVIIVCILGAVFWAVKSIGELLDLRNVHDDLLRRSTFNWYPLTYAYPTYLSKESLLAVIADYAAAKTQVAHNTYLQFTTENGEHFILPKHTSNNQELLMKIKLQVEENPGYDSLVLLTFKLIPARQKQLVALLLILFSVFALAVFSDWNDIDWAIESFKWHALVAIIIGAKMFFIRYYGSVNYYLTMMKKLEGNISEVAR